MKTTMANQKGLEFANLKTNSKQFLGFMRVLVYYSLEPRISGWPGYFTYDVSYICTWVWSQPGNGSRQVIFFENHINNFKFLSRDSEFGVCECPVQSCFEGAYNGSVEYIFRGLTHEMHLISAPHIGRIVRSLT